MVMYAMVGGEGRGESGELAENEGKKSEGRV